MQFIDLKAQYNKIKSNVDESILNVLNHGQYIMGPEVAQLEKELAEFTQAKHCIGVSSGTDALLIAMMALDIGPGDEVITTPFTFIATGEMIALLGAKPVFADINSETYNIDPEDIKKKITNKTKAIMPVSLYGQCADYDAINEIAKSHNLPVIEDGCQSFGAVYKEKKSCVLTTIGCTSFFPSKPLGCYGDGGAIFTDDDVLFTTMQQIRNHGQSERYMHSRIGLNGRLDSIQAAILIEKLKIFAGEVDLRQAVAKRYSDSLQGVVTTPYVDSNNKSVYAQYTIAVKNREGVLEKLKEANIPTAVHYPRPLHLQEAFSAYGYKKGDFPVSESLSDEVMSLPMHPYLKPEEQDLVIEALKNI